MKKLFLFAGAFMISAIGFSQVTGAGTAGTAAALPGAGVDANTGLSVQNGDGNKVRVRQAGTEQSVLTYQDNGSGLGGNLARIQQTGAVSGVSGYQNAAELNQSGTTNQATIVSGGDLNNVLVNQGQNDDASANNKAIVTQGGQRAEANYVATEQDGMNNQSSTRQSWDNSDAWTRQVGNDNKNMIVQNASPEDADGQLAYADQRGDNNESSINQSGAGARNKAFTEQYGNDNQAKQVQVTDASAGDVGNTGFILQGRNFSVTHPTESAFGQVMFDRVRTEVDDLPDFDTGTGTAEGRQSFGGIAFQNQAGNNNQAGAVQYGSNSFGSNYSKQTQLSGSGNIAYVNQNRGGGAGGDNESEQIQAGDNNETGLLQTGVGQKSLVTQYGNSNSSLSTQYDEGNLLNVHQRGNENAAISAQRGIANRTLIVQYDGQSFTAQQNLDGLGGGGNQIDAMQLGPDGDFHDAAIECNFNEQMDPTMDYTVPDFEIQDICPDC